MAVTPFIWGVVPPAGVGADVGASSSVFTAEALLFLLIWEGDVFALGPLELVPCWLACSCMLGACMCPNAGLPVWGLPGKAWFAMAGLAPIWNWLKLGVLGAPGGMFWPLTF